MKKNHRNRKTEPLHGLSHENSSARRLPVPTVGVLIAVTVLFYAVLYRIYMPRVSAFGCFDDCFNIVAGHFINNDRTLYSEIFFNHQPLPAYISAAIQRFTDPINIYELILRHRQALLLFGFGMNSLMIARFGVPAFIFMLLYEPAKYYVFGDRFLAESFIVYPLVYLLFLFLSVSYGRKVRPVDSVLVGLAAWFIFWMREPFIPLSIILPAFIHVKNKAVRSAAASFIIFSLLSLLTLLFFPPAAWFDQVVTVNRLTHLSDIGSSGLLTITRIFLFPFTLILSSVRNPFSLYAQVITAVFMVSAVTHVFRLRMWKTVLFTFIVLGLSNLRNGPPGLIFYAAFHMSNWYGLMFASASFFIWKVADIWQRLFLAGAVLAASGYMFLPGRSFITEPVTPHELYMTQYGDIQKFGSVIRTLAAQEDTLFLDGAEDLIYWEAGLRSPYRYSWYTSMMPKFDEYNRWRERMLSEHPPSFYFGNCPGINGALRELPDALKTGYVRLLEGGKPTCLHISRDVLNDIDTETWDKVIPFTPENDETNSGE